MQSSQSATLAQSVRIEDLPWIRNARFDGVFLFGIYLLAIATGFIVLVQPNLFYPVLLIDFWILGYHHVVSTYTRLCFDRASFREHRSLVLGLLPAIAAATALIAWQIGIWAIVSIYFYWQWWHYTRQSWGISRVYRARDKASQFDEGWLAQAIFYALPVLGILHRSNQQQSSFLGLDVRYLPVSDMAVEIALVATLLLLVIWIVRRIVAAGQGRLPIVHTMYMVTHFSIFAIGYLLIDDVSIGWLIVNIWHNAQYILFVWIYNNRRFRDGPDPDARILSYISQDGRLWLYLLTCLGITAIAYWGVVRSVDALFFVGLSATIILYQVLNFHHYVVDSLLWKVRKPTLQVTLGLSSPKEVGA